MKLHVTLVAPRILRFLLDFWKNCALQLLTKENMWPSDGLRQWTVYGLNVKVNHMNCGMEKVLKNFRVEHHKPCADHVGDDIKK
jgi:hypothetical protein